jgi:DNA-binding CsgD family transcriptional regulator
MLEKDLREIVSPFVDTLGRDHAKLSSRELEISRLIKNGMTSKEIAEALNLSILTVYKYRDLIRKKLGLVNDGTNLRTYLQSI